MKVDRFDEQIELPDGRRIILETGMLARQADGSVVLRMGDTILLATVVANKEAQPGVDFLPLTVDYREKFSAGGKIPGGYIKREGRPSDEEILTMRLVDRVLRPLFPDDFHAEVQVMISLISFDKEVMPDALAALAASSALAVSDIPFAGLISEVRVSRIDNQWVLNPTYSDLQRADIDIMVGATKDSIVMVEGEMKEVSEAEMLEAISIAHQTIKMQIQAQERLAEKVKKAFPKRVYQHEPLDDVDLKADFKSFAFDKVYAIAKENLPKKERKEKIQNIYDSYIERFTKEEQEEKVCLLKKYFGEINKQAIRSLILNEGVRLDGRSTQDIRSIWGEVGCLPSTHGSALFTRGETQSLTSITLGSSLDANRIDNVMHDTQEHFFLHYNFPPFSTGEARPIRGVSRREVGHGNLAQRALKNVLPDDFPYTIRVVSDILESNGSSSMATVCAGTLALMDAGVQIKAPVSGIAMGLITDKESGKWAVLSDILGDEDHLGDMDFKVTGTQRGITACQMDIKISGISYEILTQALEQAKEGRLHILGKIKDILESPRPQLKPHAPKMLSITISKDFIGAVIGPGGKNIQQIQADTETVITIKEKDALGIVEISGYDMEKINQAVSTIKNIAFEPEVGGVYLGKVLSIKPFGAFVELVKGVEGLLHKSEIDWKMVDDVEKTLKVGQKIEVKFIGRDEKNGKMRLSRKVLLPRE